jgi:ferric-dicitrate binding protein FerR (iron transport regulator)
MKLSDRDILELNELCSALVDGTLTEAQRQRLNAWLRDSEEARRFYVRLMGLSASLHHYAAEMHAEAAAAEPAPRPLFRVPWFGWAGALAAAACLVVGLWLLATRAPQAPPTATGGDDLVARLTGVQQTVWRAPARAPQPGELLRRGQRLELASGYAEVTFDSGAQVVLEGPAAIELTSPWEAALLRGTLKVNVPAEAIGFRVTSEIVEVMDLGTEFSIIAEEDGHADVLVLKGEVEATPLGSADQESIFLRENEARRFARSGVMPVADSEEKFARLSRAVPLERFDPPAHYVRWSFDEPTGAIVAADAFGPARNPFNARLEPESLTEAVARVPGVFDRALQFDGRLYARAAYPGLSGKSPRTVLFWVKVPPDAQLSSAYAMVAWWAENPKFGSRPVHIGWNRNPAEGPLGVLRTDYLGGYALGSTPLRDGRWHHIAVVFVPDPDGHRPVEVKQYVDGRLEGEGRPSAPGSVFSSEPNPTVADTLWLGCRLGDNGPRQDRFRGEMDELCIADRALGPRSIVQIMRNNCPGTTALANARADRAPTAHPATALR